MDREPREIAQARYCGGKSVLIKWAKVAGGADGLRIYRVDATAPSFASIGVRFDPLAAVLSHYETPATQEILARFDQPGAPVGPSSFRVACHVVSLPDVLLVVDSTFRSTADQIFPGALERIARKEGRWLSSRPIAVLYTHAHFDHAGGREAVEAMGADVTILSHPFTKALFPFVGQRGSFFQSKGRFFRDCGIHRSLDDIQEEVLAAYLQVVADSDADPKQHPFAVENAAPLRVDEAVAPNGSSLSLFGGRVELFCFEGHIPGHLCVWVDRSHWISGDMWLPATTSTVTPGTLTEAAGVSKSHTGFLRYVDSDERLAALPVDESLTYPSHEQIYQNPKRMVLRDLELALQRVGLIYEFLEEHRSRPFRVLDLARGGQQELPIWKLEGSKYRLLLAHDEASAFVQDLVAMGDVSEVEPERFLFQGTSCLHHRVCDALCGVRTECGELEFEKYRRRHRPQISATQ